MRLKNNHYILYLVIFSCFICVRTYAEKSPVINYVKTDKKVVALTFDADMSPYMLQELKSGKVKSWYNKELIDVLNKEQIPATMFLTGMWIEQYSTTTQELAKNSLFEIGNHSYSHPAFSNHCYKLKPVKEVNDSFQISKTNELLDKYAPNHKMYFRFPGLCYDPDDLKIASDQGYMVIGGDVFGGDGFQNDSNKIVYNVIHKIKRGSIVVLHMMGGPNAPKTSEAVVKIVKKLKSRGYEFVKVSDLIRINNATSTAPTLLETILNLLGK